MKHVIGFSGGVDSQAVARWVLNRFPADDVILLNSDAGGNEHQLTTDFINWYSHNVHCVYQCPAIISDLWKTEDFAETKGLDGDALLTFDGMAAIKKRFPSRKAQFCTTILKLIPQRRWCAENLAGQDFERYTGVRRDESDFRKDTQLRKWDDFFDCYVNNPIADWSKKMCFEYVKAHDGNFNELYKLGFNRVGCAPCINATKEDITAWSQRFPEMIDKVREWEQRVGKTFFSPRITRGIPNFVDEVVRWARTSQGGKQFIILPPRPNCESKYGVCE